ncbi:winged helix-turn-helix domain-containing protein [Sphingomicrobium flavum]|uniref:winged helix-turn-helix domain-containing protein n=1 Tax=Sphingomicrobium flavum TaxID=1229164 RepID=UPI0021AD8802|nr:winged helix-turn-helix domain-containing protein [Sphingomicrobium flavum]
MEEVRIGSHLLQPNRQLLLDGEHVHLGPRALSLLTILAQADGEIVTKDELMDAVWPDVTVEENALQVHMTSVRKALGQDAHLLHTLRGIGYQLETGNGSFRNVVTEGSSAPARPVQAGGQPQSWRPTLAIVVGGLLALIAAVIFFDPFGSSPPGRQAPTTLAVMPLNVSGNAEWQQRSDALTASLTSNLSQVPNISFASITAARSLTDEGLSPAEIGARLNVDHFIEGDVQATGNRLVGLIRLIDVSTGRAIWSGEITGEQKYPDEFEALLLNKISGVLIALHKIAGGDIEIPTDIDPRAYEAYLDGLARLTVRRPEDYPPALRQMQIAASIEPDFAAAHAGIAYTLAVATNGNFMTVPREQYLAMQEAANRRALELDPENHMAMLAAASVELGAHGKIAQSLETTERLLERRPNDGQTHLLRSIALWSAGDLEDAATHMDRAMTADPFNYQLEYYRRALMTAAGDYPGVKISAQACRVDCWAAAHQWWAALLRIGTKADYVADIDAIGEIYDDDRSYPTGEATKPQSLKSHAQYMLYGTENRFMEGFYDTGYSYGLTDWTLLIFQYGYADAGFGIAMRNIEAWPVGYVLKFFHAGRLDVPEEIRADPRYHAIFDIPRFKALADYRRARGMTDGLPVFPVKAYVEE